MTYDIKQSFVSNQYLGQADYSITYSFLHVANITLGDFDKNGLVDIMSFPTNYITPDGSYQFKPVIWLNNNGTFAATDLMASGMTTQFARDVIIDDFNNDGFLDYIAVDQGFEPGRLQPGASHSLYYPNLMLGTETGLDYVPMSAWNSSLSTARVFNHIGDSADFNNDGTIDFAIASFGGGIKLYQNNGDGTFVSKDILLPYFNNVSGVSFIHLPDNKVGLIAGMYCSPEALSDPVSAPPQLYVYENGAFKLQQVLYRLNVAGVDPLSQGMVDTENVDINGDGREDVLMLWECVDSPVSTYMSVYTQNSNGMLDKKYDLPITSSAQDATSDIQLTDLDKDGDLDFYVLAAGPDGGWRISELDQAIWLNDGLGNFSHPTNFFNLVEYTSTRWEDKFGIYNFFDANNDGTLDVVALSSVFTNPPTKTIGQEITVFLNQAQSIAGTSGNDTFAQNRLASAQNDIFNGGGGIDTLALQSTVSNFKIFKDLNSDGHLMGYILKDTTGNTNTSQIYQVERLHFSDATVALDIGKGEIAGEAYRIYKAAFDRVPDAGGLGFWINAMDDGASLTSVAAGFINSPEFQKLYGANVSDRDYVTKLYNNVLDRNPDQGGYDFWLGALANGASREDILVNFSESKENMANVADLISNGIQYQEWLG